LCSMGRYNRGRNRLCHRKIPDGPTGLTNEKKSPATQSPPLGTTPEPKKNRRGQRLRKGERLGQSKVEGRGRDFRPLGGNFVSPCAKKEDAEAVEKHTQASGQQGETPGCGLAWTHQTQGDNLSMWEDASTSDNKKSFPRQAGLALRASKSRTRQRLLRQWRT
jgi:hypothetical protein